MQRLVFHHIPKCAGTSVYYFVAESLSPEQVATSFDVTSALEELSRDGLAGKRFLSGHFTLPFLHYNLPDWQWFTFLRDPIRRTISQYENYRDGERHQERWIHNQQVRRDVDAAFAVAASGRLLDFLQAEEPALVRGVCFNQITRSLIMRNIDRRDWRLDMYDEALVEEATDNLFSRFAMFGLVEEMESSVRLMTGLFDIRSARPVLHHNRAQQPRDVSPQEQELLEALNRMDMAVYGRAGDMYRRRMQSFDDGLMRHRLEEARKAGVWREQRAPGARLVELRCDERMPGSGWSASERGLGSLRYRWTLGTAVTWVPHYGDPMQVELHLVGHPDDLHLSTVTLNIGGRAARLAAHHINDFGIHCLFDTAASARKPLQTAPDDNWLKIAIDSRVEAVAGASNATPRGIAVAAVTVRFPA